MSAADRSDHYQSHHCLRSGIAALAEAFASASTAEHRRIEALRRYTVGYLEELHTHHTVEDQIFFPALAVRVPISESFVRRAEHEHLEIDDLVDQLRSAVSSRISDRPGLELAAQVSRSLARVLRAHLDNEDLDIVPLFTRHFQHDEYEALNKQALRSIGVGRQTFFRVPFALAGVDDATRKQLLANAPAPTRIVWRLTKRRYGRLRSSALTPTASQLDLSSRLS